MGYIEDRAKRKLGLLPPLQTKKDKKPIRRSFCKKNKVAIKNTANSNMYSFFLSQRKNMTGYCLFCGGKTTKDDDKTFHYSLAHLLPKRAFKSVSTHPDILIELCHFGNSCHANFDNGIISWDDISKKPAWGVIKEKLKKILPLVSEQEKRNKLYSRIFDLVFTTQES